ncbi:MAG: ABC transporter ATP-binding protein, partial [Bdellovibrionales bacterium]|nr:ABC transporter ATP-binding protein [Bdellovibrionales bacterium]
MDKAIEVRNLVKSYGQVVAVNKINFSINRGECFGIIGPNGAGKSSLLRMLYCTTLQDSGELYILGLNSRSSYSEIKGRIGVVPQDDGLDPDFTVLDNLLVYARFFGIPMAEAKSRAHRLLRILKLEEYEKYRCDQLSGGLRRRLSIARAMLNKPEVLFLDEPTTGLDPQARYFVWESIEALKKEKITILLTTHYMEEAEQSCDRIMIMDKGSIIGEGLPSQLIQNHVGSEIIE